MNEITAKKKIEDLIRLFSLDSKVVLKKKGEIVFVDLELSDPILLIGRDGAGLNALQHLIRLLISKEEETRNPVVLDVNGYRKKRLAAIEKETGEAIKRVKETGRKEILPPMNSFERLLVHQLVSKAGRLLSKSEGAGEERRVVIEVEN